MPAVAFAAAAAAVSAFEVMTVVAAADQEECGLLPKQHQ